MIHPSYRELMDKINEENEAEGKEQVTSRYSVVLATSKRAREITNGAEPLARAKSGKALSVAIEEFYEGKVKMEVAPEHAEEEVIGPDEAEAVADVQAFLQAEAEADAAEAEAAKTDDSEESNED